MTPRVVPLDTYSSQNEHRTALPHVSPDPADQSSSEGSEIEALLGSASCSAGQRLAPSEPERLLAIVLILVAIVVGADPLSHPAEGAEASVTRTVQAVTSTGRRGTYYLPSNYDSRTLPLMVGFHGSGGTGSLMIRRLQAMAEREGFIALAPDSVSIAGVWSVGQRSDEVTEDYRHVMDCVREVMRAPGVRIDPARVLAVGFSVGASVAPYIATHESQFTALAVLHGHITPASLGPLRPRAWVSAGDQDRVRTVDYMRSVADHLKRAGFPAVGLRVFKADHRLADDELAALVAWWLGKR